MGELLPLLVVAGALAATMGFFTWLASVVRRRGVAGTAIRAALASYNEAFQATAHQSHHEIRAQEERRVPMSSPGDPWGPGRDGAGRPGVEGRRPLRPRPRRPRWGLRLRRRGRRPGHGR